MGKLKTKCSCKEGIGVKRDTFSSFHPIVGLLFFVLVLGFTMFFMHPVCLGISLVCALAYSARLEGGEPGGSDAVHAAPAAVHRLLNPLFNHQGRHGAVPASQRLFHHPGGCSLTAGRRQGMLLAVVVWFRCFGARHHLR